MFPVDMESFVALSSLCENPPDPPFAKGGTGVLSETDS
jgi:hypothetical protein